MIVLITGPVRSGKSTRAVFVARELGLPVTHVVTARVDPSDREMAARIAHHRRERGNEPTIELWQPGGPDLGAIVAAAPARTTLLVDSLGTWLAGHLLDSEALVETDTPAAQARLEALCDPLGEQLRTARAHVVVVAEETGWGLVPATPQGRIFRDQLGRVVQLVGRIAARVELVVAGYALDLRRWGVSVSDAQPN
jgi:adenosylcobinamide kinase/adenosylcobinamide-phosphate guanylyltransferase